MRKFALFLLLATAAAPAFAQAEQDRGDRRHRGQAAEQSETLPQRAEGRRPDAGDQRALRSQSPERSQTIQQDGIREQIRQQREQRQQSASTQSDSEETVRSLRRGERRGETSETSSTLVPRERRVRTIPDTQPAVTSERRSGVARVFDGRPRRDYRDGNYTRWSDNWRYDHRYDWRRYRDRYRTIFRLGSYYDPFGWSYRRWSPGLFLYPSYYGSSFWLDDPWHYRLPPAYGPYRWVRYWDDALLVNIYTGQVVDVVHNFFW